MEIKEELFLKREKIRLSKTQKEKERAKKEKKDKVTNEEILDTQHLILELLTGERID